MHDAVIEALLRTKERRYQRSLNNINLLHQPGWLDGLEKLRGEMFSRREPGEAFHPLSDGELALLEYAIRGHAFTQHFRVGVGADHPLMEQYSVMRQNHLMGEEVITPEQFREAAELVATFLLNLVVRDYELSSDSIVLLPWRGALVFAEPALRLGMRQFHHLGARRNEATLETEVYFNEPVKFSWPGPSNRHALVLDPMLATGNTDITAIEHLSNRGIAQDRIIVVSIVSAPEGVDHLLDTYPKVRVITGRHDERLNSNGYIEEGLGDFGDRWFASQDVRLAHRLLELKVLTETSHAALVERMTEKTAA